MTVREYLGDISIALRVAATAYRSFSDNDFFEPKTNFLPELAEIRESEAAELDPNFASLELGSWTPREAHVQLGLGKSEAWGPGSVRWRVRQSERRLEIMAGRSSDFQVSGPQRNALERIRQTSKSSIRRLKDELVPAFHWRAPAMAAGPPRRTASSGCEYRVWFATDRRRADSGAAGVDYLEERNDCVHYGACDVFVPERRVTGSLGSRWWKRIFIGDDRLRIQRAMEMDPAGFWRALRTQVGVADAGERHAVVFIHGYNTSFHEAAVRTAQLGVDLRIMGAMAFFSWPSIGRMRWYTGDEAAIEASEPAITQFLIDFARLSEAEAVHIIAHSMGNRALLRAVSKIAASAQVRSGKMFNQIVLAAPDVDCSVFKNLAVAYKDICERTTLYAASGDRAVGVSAWVHRYARAGLLPPVTIVEGVDTIDASRAGLTGVGHDYFCRAKQVLGDIYELVRSGTEPAKRFGMRRQIDADGGGYWQLR